MIITHEMAWDKCLSHQIWPAIKKGWKDKDTNIHFFWGLAGSNLRKIQECIDKKEEWYYVDIGYLTQQPTRYPEPKIHDIDKTYFRIIKGKLHTIRCTVGDGKRLNELKDKGIDVEFKGWRTTRGKYILLAPSSQTVTQYINGISQQEWIDQVTHYCKQYSDLPVKLRNKPRPNNQWWNTDIKDDLKDAQCLVTNMSLSAIDAVMNCVPAICHQNNICSFISSADVKFVEKPMKPGRKTMNEWLKMVVENQFTIPEIESGLAYETLQHQFI